MQGYLEAIEPFQARGWAFDPEQPALRVEVHVLLKDQIIGKTTARLFRPDLERGQIGDGAHAFIFNFDRRLDPSEINLIAVRAVTSTGRYQALALLPPSPPTEIIRNNVLSFNEQVYDESQEPIFVLGAARSGTSAIAQALLKLGYEGHQEGHFFDLLAHWSVSLNKFYDVKSDELSGGRDTLVARVPPVYLQSSLDAIFVKAAAAAFPTKKWIDKTPNSDTTYLAPRFKRLWPNARFIFMKRRFLENARSRSRKFPGFAFERNCREWRDAMKGWHTVRPELAGAAIEIDQRFLDEHPDDVAQAIRKMLGLPEDRAQVLQQALQFDWPERTSNVQHNSALDLESIGWDSHQRQLYEELCVEMMQLFGYSSNTSYFQSEHQNNGMVII